MPTAAHGLLYSWNALPKSKRTNGVLILAIAKCYYTKVDPISRELGTLSSTDLFGYCGGLFRLYKLVFIGYCLIWSGSDLHLHEEKEESI